MEYEPDINSTFKKYIPETKELFKYHLTGLYNAYILPIILEPIGLFKENYFTTNYFYGHNF